MPRGYGMRWKRRREHERDRLRRGERPFLFDATVTTCIGSPDPRRWIDAIAVAGGAVGEAAALCGIEGVPRDAKALWGRSW
jgi:hypothetical protein